MIRFSLILVMSLTALTAEAAVRQNGQKAFADTGTRARPEQKEAAADGSIWDKIREKLPEIDFSEFDGEAEKEKLREAVRKMDEIGISPEKLARRAWEFVTRRENKEKIDNAARDIRDQLQKAAEEGSNNEVVKKVREETGKAAEKVSREIADRAAEKVTEEAGKAADKVTKEITEQAAQEGGESAGQEK